MYDLERKEITYADIVDLKNETRNILNNLNYQYNVGYHTEVFDGIFQNVKGFFTTGLQNIGNWFQSIKERTPDPIPHFYKFKDTHHDVTKFCKNADNYLKYASVEIPYMSGCKVAYPVFIELLCKVTDKHSYIVMTMIDELDSYVSKLLSDSNYRLSHKPENKTKPMAEAKSFADAVEVLNHDLIDPKLYRDTLLFEQFTPNLSELIKAGDRLEGLSKVILKDNIDKTLHRAKSVSDKVKSLVNELMIKENTQCTKTALDNLKSKVEVSAHAVTALSTYYYFVSEAVKIYKVLPKVLK